MPNPSTLARDEHGIVKAGVSFEQSPWESAAAHYHAVSRVICRDCVAKDETIRILSERLAAASACLGRVAERAERRAEADRVALDPERVV